MDYFICSTPRSGSNLLCSLLMQTGVAGEPREYLCPFQIAEHGPATSGLATVEGHPGRFQRYFDGVRGRYASGGRFGYKAHFHQLAWAIQHGFDLVGNLPQRFVHLTRADVLGQAISFVRAAQTGAWISDKPERREPVFDPEGIREAIRVMNTQNQAWEQLFDAQGIEPYRMSYETLVADFEGELGALLEFLEVPAGAVDVAAAVAASTRAHRKQRDGVSAEWRRRYRELVRQRAEERAAASAA